MSNLMMPTKTTLKNLVAIIKALPINTISQTVLPEFNMNFKNVQHTLAVANLPLNSESLAYTICKLAALTIPKAKMEEILARLQFIVEANKQRTWHVVQLLDIIERTPDKFPAVTALSLPHKIANAMSNITEVEALLIEDMLHWNLRSYHRYGFTNLHGCTRPGEPIALFSSLNDCTLVQGCVEALGYFGYEVKRLQGEDIPSLLRQACNDSDDQPDSDTDDEPIFVDNPQEERTVILADTDSDEMEEPATMQPGNGHEKPAVKAKPNPGLLSVIQEESLRDKNETGEPATMRLRDADDANQTSVLKAMPEKEIPSADSPADVNETEKPAKMRPGDADDADEETVHKANPEDETLCLTLDDSRYKNETEEPPTMRPRPQGDRYVENRGEPGRIDTTLLLETTMNLTIDSD